ncbi:MAG TPA: rRNA maturation RNase YbeY [Steroidobacteraceae bacterium]|nr:rRNA maturation RNase YbeY [Steroidobacteraceae bacterium]
MSYAARRPWVPRRADFARWAAAALPRSSAPVDLSIRVVGTAASRRLNLRFRGKPRPTNVLSFAGAGRTPDGRRHLGELLICAPLVAREARAARRPAPAHWAHLTVHGVLHLRGFDHERDRDAREMIAMEVQILDRLGFSDPYR